MSWKALIIGDVHYRATNPVARLDNFKEALDAKLRECWNIASWNDVDAIIQTGDLFDSPGIVYTTLADLIHVLKDAPAPIYTVPGNHDLFAAHPESLYRTPLGFLFQLGVVENATLGVTTWGDSVQLTGRGYDAGADVDPTYYEAVSDPFRVRIHVTHGMLVDRPFPGRHTLVSDLASLRSAPDVLINGHYHLGTGIRRVGKTLVINPGALCRQSAHVEEMDRTVQVALLTVDEDGCRVELIPLHFARPSHEVLSREHLVVQAEREQRRSEFLDLLNSEETRVALDVAEMMGSIAEREQLPATVQETALAYLARAEEAMVG